ncbi:MAG: SH3 domain-containing protein, partial [Propionibacteriaceae bacterium]
VHRALCHRYPQVRSFLGVRSSSGFHGEGRALDCMISDSSVGWDLAKWVRANARSLGVMEVIYRQQIWTVQRSSEGWRSMSDRGSPTANHMDHVHVSVYGNSGTA